MWLRKVLVVLAVIVNCSLALKLGDDGVCVVKISTQRTRSVSYTAYSNKKCGKKKCTVTKIRRETYQVPINQTICCNGWEYATNEDRCNPSCSTGCRNGKCIAPDVCQCTPPARLHADSNDCVYPTCNPGCFNGNCVDSQCECLSETTKHNATHCLPKCSEGYFIDVNNGTCEPKCDSCEHGECIAPDTCLCKDGYERTGDECVPKCNPECENGICTGVNTCACNDGFKVGDETWKCEPVCQFCDNGHCVAPGNCECNEGFVKTDDKCEPEDKEATEECPEGTMKKDGESKCSKPCSVNCTGSCIDGECRTDGSCKKLVDK